METEEAPTDPRVVRSRDKVLTAVREQLAARGYDGLTIEGVADRAGVGKATIYRHWDSKAQLVVDAASHLRAAEAPPREGTVVERTTRLYESLAWRLWDPSWSRHLPSLLDAAGRDPQVAMLFTAFIDGRRAPTADVIRDGVARGELPEATDVDATIDQIAGPLFYRRYFSDRGVADGEVADLVRRVLADPPLRR
ncbi:MAG TPA: TetR/AcrR family transcriptional regulator [Euzebyales bacterium]|nr:TetR/AcrR family transcriptional regulator [Euzebyales bacterium]